MIENIWLMEWEALLFRWVTFLHLFRFWGESVGPIVVSSFLSNY